MSAPASSELQRPIERDRRGREHVGVAKVVLTRVAAPAAKPLPAAGVSRLDRWLARRVLVALNHPPLALVLWNGEQVKASGDVVAKIVIRDRAALWKLVLGPELHFGDAYTAGRIEVEGNMLQMLETVYRSLDARKRIPKPRRHSNSLAGSRENIHHHYDIGNDFYALWLDREMLYTCAYFRDASATLEAAQQAKMEHVCRKLWLRPGETVVEAGCGWGALALYMARHYGVSVRAFNVCHEQIVYARQRARQEGLDGRVEFVEDDYRNISGRYDAFASIGMMEHVGPEHYGQLGRVIDRSLSPTGRGILHFIGRDRPGPVNAWIERRIFPGAYPPTLREATGALQPCGFSVLDVENLRLHYAETIRHWLARFDAAEPAIRAMFDEPFVRAWRLYLIGSIAGFTTGSLQLFQIVFSRPGTNDIPWTRETLYRQRDHGDCPDFRGEASY